MRSPGPGGGERSRSSRALASVASMRRSREAEHLVEERAGQAGAREVRQRPRACSRPRPPRPRQRRRGRYMTSSSTCPASGASARAATRRCTQAGSPSPPGDAALEVRELEVACARSRARARAWRRGARAGPKRASTAARGPTATTVLAVERDRAVGDRPGAAPPGVESRSPARGGRAGRGLASRSSTHGRADHAHAHSGRLDRPEPAGTACCAAPARSRRRGCAAPPPRRPSSKVVPAAETTFSSIMTWPKSLQPMCSAAWATPPPMVTHDAWRFGTLSRTSRASAFSRR